MESSLGKKALTGTAWKFAERFLAQGITTLVSIVLARILDPAHYGVIAIVNVFITLCNVFVVTGLGESLIQKKDADDLDFSSIFYINVTMSIVLYVILFIAAPFITKFYGDGYEQLTAIIRVMGIRLILAAINSIQSAKVTRELAFKKYFFVTLIGTLISGVVGISMAYAGFGVWALVSQYMTNTTIDTIMLFIFVGWYPKLMFSFERSKGLVKYGVRILYVSVVNTFIGEIQNLFIGKFYSPQDLAFYTKGQTYPKLLANNLSIAISTTLFPVLAQAQDDLAQMRKIASKAIKLITFLVFPALCGLALVADDFISFLLTDKWLPCVPYLRILCIYFALNPLITTNSQCLTARGDSKTFSRLTIISKILGLVILFVALPFGVIWIAVAMVAGLVLEYLIKTVPCQKMFNYGLFAQIKDMLPTIIGCLLMAGAVLITKRFVVDLNSFTALVIQAAVGAVVYLLFALVTRNDQLKYLIGIVKRKRKK